MMVYRRTVAISEAEELTQRNSKTADRGLRLHRFVIDLSVGTIISERHFAGSQRSSTMYKY